jgi:glucarate dehydratase
LCKQQRRDFGVGSGFPSCQWCGAHAPFFTRNLVILTDSAGNTGVGEVPGGEKIRQTLDAAQSLIVGQSLGHWNAVLARPRQRWARFADL